MTELLKKGVRLGYNERILQRWISFFGEKFTDDIIETFEKGIKPSIRINTLKTRYELIVDRLNEKGFKLEESSLVKNGFWINHMSYPLGATTEYLLGYYTIQGIASQLPAIVLDPQPGERILDMTAAPGMKATQIAALMENQGVLICIDWNPDRLRSLLFNVGRLNVQNHLIYQMDAKKVGKFRLKFDKILLDAPCTGSGIIFKDMSRKKSRTEEDIFYMNKIQEKLLKVGFKVLKPGGRLVYSTCSLEPEENECVIDTILKDENIRIEKLNIGGEPGLRSYQKVKFQDEIFLAHRFFPNVTKTEGFFICSLIKD